MKLWIALVGLAMIGCASTPSRTWRDEAAACYQQGGLGISYAGRTGLAACDRYVDDQRYEDARRDARQDALFQLLLNPPPTAPLPTRSTSCQSRVIGDRIDTSCRSPVGR